MRCQGCISDRTGCGGGGGAEAGGERSRDGEGRTESSGMKNRVDTGFMSQRAKTIDLEKDAEKTLQS